MIMDNGLEDRISEIEAISELFETYIDHKTEELNPVCLCFLSEKLQKNIGEINKILVNEGLKPA